MNNPEAIILYVDAEQTVDDTFIDRIPYLNKIILSLLKKISLNMLLIKLSNIAEKEW